MFDNGTNGHGGHKSVGLVQMEAEGESDGPASNDVSSRQSLDAAANRTLVTIGGQVVMGTASDTPVARTADGRSASGEITVESSSFLDRRARVAAYQIHGESESVCRRRRALIGLLLFFGVQIVLGLWLGRRSSGGKARQLDGVTA